MKALTFAAIAACLLLSAYCFAQVGLRSPAFVANLHPPTAALVTNALVSGQTVGTARNDFGGQVGFKFTANANMTVIQLGRWVIAGNGNTHTLVLKDSSCNDLGSCSVNTSGAGTGAYLYGNITPVALTSGQTYILVSGEASSGDQFYNSDTTITTTADCTLTFAEYTVGAVPPCVDEAPSKTFGPVNLIYYK